MPELLDALLIADGPGLGALGSAIALNLQIPVHLMGVSNRLLAKRKSQRIGFEAEARRVGLPEPGGAESIPDPGN